jgi:hypothetical protein
LRGFRQQASGRQVPSTMAWVLVVRPLREQSIAVIVHRVLDLAGAELALRTATRSVAVKICILRRRDTSEKLLASETLTNVTSEFNSVTDYPNYGNVISGSTV